MRISLIGSPRLVRDGEELPRPRGLKSWAVLARLLLSRRPVTRRQLAEELFSDADDPLGALRWTLAELRRRLEAPDAFRGDPISGDLPAAITVDVLALQEGAADAAETVGELLEGVEGVGSPEFDTWLLIERQRVQARVLSGLRQGTLRALSAGDHERAVELARRSVAGAPFEEWSHVLLVKALVASGNEEAAGRHIASCEELFRRELGVDPSPAIRSAGRRSVADPAPGVSPRSSARSLLEAGRAALAAGAVDAGIECLRRAVADAERAGDASLRAATLLQLGTALVHTLRGYDDEGAVALHQAADLASDVGEAPVAAEALKELAYVDIQAGRRTDAERALAAAITLAGDDPALLSGIHGFAGLNLGDWGRFEEAMGAFHRSMEQARHAGQRRQTAWTLGLGARTLIDLGDLDGARSWLGESLRLSEEERWTSFRPWSEALLAEVELTLGRAPDTVRGELEQTFALSCQLGDPCWEGMAAKGIGLTHRAERSFGEALAWMREGRTRCLRFPDSYVWVEGSILEAEGRTALEAGEADLGAEVAQRLLDLAARTQMDAFVDRALELMRS